VAAEEAPQTWEAPLAAELRGAGADRDAELVAAAQALMALVDAAGSRAGKYNVQVAAGRACRSATTTYRRTSSTLHRAVEA
jgi:hypothetical protein